MFHRHEKKFAPSQIKPIKDLSTILTPDALLAPEKRSALIKQIRESFQFETERFDGLCLALISNMVTHCQNLPETLNSYYAQQGGFVDNALNRTEIALQLFSQFVILPEHMDMSEEQKLWQYALFSAALLQGIGKLQSDFSIKLYDAHGHYLKEHNPLMGSFALMSSYYAYSFQKDPDDEFRKRLNLLLARMLMPSAGFCWIASNAQVLSVWLALLNEDYQGAKTFGALLIRSQALALQRYFNQPLSKQTIRSPLYGGAGTFSGGVPTGDIEQKIGMEFMQWLTKGLASGDLVLNKPYLTLVHDGVLMSAEIFKMFAAGHPNHRSWQVARAAMLALGLHEMGDDGSILSRFEHKETHKVQAGIYVTDFAVLLPPEVSVFINSKTTIRMTALELINQTKFLSNYTLQQITPQTTLQGVNIAGQLEPMPEVQRSSSLSMSTESRG